MTVNKDELRELIENDLFGEGAFSLDDLVENEKVPTASTESFFDSDFSIEPVDDLSLGEEIASLSSPAPITIDDEFINFEEPAPSFADTPAPAFSDTEEIVEEEEQSLEAFFEDVEKRLDSVEQDVFEAVEQAEVFDEPAEPEEIQAIQEQQAPEAPQVIEAPQTPRVDVRPIEFPELEEQISGQSFDLGFFANIPVKIDVHLGDTTISLKDVYNLTEGAIVSLDKLFGEPLELRINGQVIAKGEVVAVDKQYGVMIKEIIRAQP